MKSFDEVLGETENCDRHVLLGNGFSQAWNKDIFNYKNLLDSADFGFRGGALREVFSKLKTYDFEKVMNIFVASVYVSQSFGQYPVFVEGIERDIDRLKDSLLSAIASTHPDLPHDIPGHQYELARGFLGYFDSIFTVNYDLLMYWARNMDEYGPEGFFTDDGFRQEGVWIGPDSQDVFFLHGGLHIYDEGVGIKKHFYRGGAESILVQVRENLRNNNFPVFVSEPSSEKKLEKIMHNSYLSYCYARLKDIGGALIIYGHSMSEADEHIFEQANLSGVEDVYVSIFGDSSSRSNRSVKEKAKSYFHSCNVYFYQAESARIWG